MKTDFEKFQDQMLEQLSRTMGIPRDLISEPFASYKFRTINDDIIRNGLTEIRKQLDPLKEMEAVNDRDKIEYWDEMGDIPDTPIPSQGHDEARIWSRRLMGESSTPTRDDGTWRSDKMVKTDETKP